MGDKVIIREARSEDCEDIIRLIQELADHDKMPTAPKIDADTFRRDGFGEEKLFRCFVAECSKKRQIIGYTVYFFHYSTWEGVSVYMEDLYVTPSYRRRGIGVKLWREVAHVAVNRKCNRLDWICLGWNKNAIEMYKSKGALNLTTDKDWNMFRMTGEQLQNFANCDHGHIPVKPCRNGV